MTRHQKIEMINHQLETLDNEALEGLIKLLGFKGKHTQNPKPDIDEESQVWLEAELAPSLPYEWGDIDPMKLGEPLRYVKGKGWVSK
jgi:hypothetical protein